MLGSLGCASCLHTLRLLLMFWALSRSWWWPWHRWVWPIGSGRWHDICSKWATLGVWLHIIWSCKYSIGHLRECLQVNSKKIYTYLVNGPSLLDFVVDLTGSKASSCHQLKWTKKNDNSGIIENRLFVSGHNRKTDQLICWNSRDGWMWEPGGDVMLKLGWFCAIVCGLAGVCGFEHDGGVCGCWNRRPASRGLCGGRKLIFGLEIHSKKNRE